MAIGNWITEKPEKLIKDRDAAHSLPLAGKSVCASAVIRNK